MGEELTGQRPACLVDHAELVLLARPVDSRKRLPSLTSLARLHFRSSRPRGTVARAHRLALSGATSLLAASGASAPPGGAGLMRPSTRLASLGALPAAVGSLSFPGILRRPPFARPPSKSQKERGEGSPMSVSAADVKALRDRTGAAMMDCKAALSRGRGRHRPGDRDPAGQGPGLGRQARRAGDQRGRRRLLHPRQRQGRGDGRGPCETDFVARNEDFEAFAYEVALHVAATAPTLSPPRRSRPRSARPRSGSSRRRRARTASPTTCVEKIVEGQLAKWAKEVALLDQTHVNAEKHDGEDDRGAAPGAGGEDRREHPRRPLRLLPRRRTELRASEPDNSAASC